MRTETDRKRLVAVILALLVSSMIALGIGMRIGVELTQLDYCGRQP